MWQKAMELVTAVYRATETFPAREQFGLTNQLCRAAVAVPSDIAEGKGRISKKEYIQMLARARGSLYEVQTQLEVARNLDYLAPDTFQQLFDLASRTGRLLNGLMNKIELQITEDATPPNPRHTPKS
ncbi:MAG TPA: four helix bundle protein [Thermoanaerobaculia bacterium]